MMRALRQAEAQGKAEPTNLQVRLLPPALQTLCGSGGTVDAGAILFAEIQILTQKFSIRRGRQIELR